MWEYNLTTAILILPLTHLHMCEMGSSIFATRSQFKFVSTTMDSLPSILSTDRKNVENVSVDSGSSYLVFIYYTFPIESRAFPLVPSCRCLRPSLQIWYQLWCQSVFLISPGYGRHIVYPIRTHTDVTLHLVYCCPDVLEFFCVHS